MLKLANLKMLNSHFVFLYLTSLSISFMPFAKLFLSHVYLYVLWVGGYKCCSVHMCTPMCTPMCMCSGYARMATTIAQAANVRAVVS